MSMSTHIAGFVPPDEKWKEMKAVWDACKKAGTAVPEEVEEFFRWGEPDENGHEVEIQCKDWSGESGSGIEIEISKLPKNVKIVRFYNLW